ncbi:hypothetical protein AB0J02_04060, partial [Streptomyces sp. NPDC050264]
MESNGEGAATDRAKSPLPVRRPGEARPNPGTVRTKRAATAPRPRPAAPLEPPGPETSALSRLSELVEPHPGPGPEDTPPAPEKPHPAPDPEHSVPRPATAAPAPPLDLTPKPLPV